MLTIVDEQLTLVFLMINILINIYLTLGVVLCGGLTFFDPYPCMHNACSKYRMAVRDIHQFFAEVSAVPITHDGKARLFCD